MASCMATPSSPTSLKPEENTMALRAPLRPSAWTVSSTCGAGTAMIATSGASGSASTLA
ncbi:hypothetical protein D3C80_2143930 [compost metagenome]